MVPVLDGNSKIDARVWRDFGYFICLKHYLDREQSQISLISEKTYFPSCSEKPSNIGTMILSALWRWPKLETPQKKGGSSSPGPLNVSWTLFLSALFYFQNTWFVYLNHDGGQKVINRAGGGQICPYNQR